MVKNIAPDCLGRPLFRGLSHVAGFFAALSAGLILVIEAVAATQIVASFVYWIGLMLTLGTSSIYHRIKWSPKAYMRMRNLDHSMIYALIASSATPFALLLLQGWFRVVILIGIWLLASVGIILRWSWHNQPRWLQVSFYLGMGWACASFLPALNQAGMHVLLLVIISGVLYTIGGLVYLIKFPNPFPRTFGFHEIFHALVVLAASCHFIAVWPLVTSNA